MSEQYKKTVNEKLDYKFDFKPFTNGREGAKTDFLVSGETITSYILTVDTGITKDSDILEDTDTSILMWFSGGTINSTYKITCLVTTSDSRELERVMFITIVLPKKR